MLDAINRGDWLIVLGKLYDYRHPFFRKVAYGRKKWKKYMLRRNLVLLLLLSFSYLQPFQKKVELGIRLLPITRDEASG